MDPCVCREAHWKSKPYRFHFTLGPFTSYQNLLLISIYMFAAPGLARSVYLALEIIQSCFSQPWWQPWVNRLLVFLAHLLLSLSLPLMECLCLTFSSASPFQIPLIVAEKLPILKAYHSLTESLPWLGGAGEGTGSKERSPQQTPTFLTLTSSIFHK